MRVEEELERTRKELEVVTGQTSSLKSDQELAEERLDASQARVAQRNIQLKATRRDLRKSGKLLLRTKDEFYRFSFDDVVRRAHSRGLDHKILLDEGESDPVDWADDDDPLIVSSGKDELLSP